MGIPVITTNWSGPTAFMNEDVGYPLSIDGLVEIVADGPHFFSYFVGGAPGGPGRGAGVPVLLVRALVALLLGTRQGCACGGKRRAQALARSRAEPPPPARRSPAPCRWAASGRSPAPRT